MQRAEQLAAITQTTFDPFSTSLHLEKVLNARFLAPHARIFWDILEQDQIPKVQDKHE